MNIQSNSENLTFFQDKVLAGQLSGEKTLVLRKHVPALKFCNFEGYCGPMINKPPPFKGLNIRIPVIILVKGRGFINQGSTLHSATRCCQWSSVRSSELRHMLGTAPTQ